MTDVVLQILMVLGVLNAPLILAALLIWLERRFLALLQDRYGPNRVGPFGLGIVLADMIKIFTKEDWVPPFADRAVFILAPAVIVITGLMSVAVIPITETIGVTDLNIGLLFFLAMSSMGVYSVVLAGWASNNKYALLGGLRASAQMVSYEVFMGLSLMGVVLMAGSFSLREIVEAQRNVWFIVPQCPRLHHLLHRGTGRDPSAALRSARGRGRAGGGFPLRVLGDEVRHVLRRRVHRRHRDLGHDGNAVLRRLAGAGASGYRVVCAEAAVLHSGVHHAAGGIAPAAVRQLMAFGWKVLLPLSLLNLVVTAGPCCFGTGEESPML